MLARVSSARTPRWWRALWRRRYPMGVNGALTVWPDQNRPPGYAVMPLGCGCGYTVWRGSDRVGRAHYPTLGGAIRAAYRDAEERTHG